MATTARGMRRDEAADAGTIGMVLLVAIVVILAGTLYLMTSGFAKSVDSDSFAQVVPFMESDGEFQFTLVKTGAPGYDLDGTRRTGHSVRVTIDGNECDPLAGEVRVDGGDSVWDLGERLIIDNGNCNGNVLSPTRLYTVIIVLDEKVAYNENAYPTGY